MKKIYSKNKKITFVLVLTIFIFFNFVVSAGNTQDITVTLEYYGPFWDINHSGQTNYLDVSLLVSSYGDTGETRPPRDKSEFRVDITGDGVVDYLDVSSLVSHYGERWLVP